MKRFAGIATVFLGLMALLQLVRIGMGWVVSVNGMSVPVWVSAVACVFAGGLALMLWKENRA